MAIRGRKGGPVHQGRAGYWFQSRWHPELQLLPDDERTMPMTVPHEEIAEHRILCMCHPCRAYPDELKTELYQARLRSLARRPR